MDLSTTYLGFKLPHPLIHGASPLVDDLDTVKRLEDAGAAAIVMFSLFEEQITREQINTLMNVEMHADSFAEALSYFPEPEDYRLGPEAYLEQIARIKAAVGVPVIASLNGISPRGWLQYAPQLQEAGADALELNIYHLSTQVAESGETVENRAVEIVRTVREAVKIPVAVKLSPFFSALTHLGARLTEAGADGLVLFNRFYQPDIDIEALDVTPSLELSNSSELLLRLRWLAIMYGQVKADLACSGGVHTAADALKAVMAGAGAVQLVSALLKHGPGKLTELRDGMARWLEEHEYESLQQAQGSMSHRNCPNPEALERANYVRILQTWRP